MKIFFCLVFCLSAITALAGEQTKFTIKKEFKDICKDCGIEKVFFHVVPYSESVEENKYGIHGTLLYAGFEAKSWEEAQKYGFVQYIRGCTFESIKNKDGTIGKRVGEAIYHLGKRVTFAIPDWSFDANTLDPLYYGPSEEDEGLAGGRLSLYRWTSRVGAFTKRQSKALHEILEMPAEKHKQFKPRLFVIDTPSAAYHSNTSKAFTNIALEFRMCLYKLQDIPKEVSSETKLPEPIFCQNWDSQIEFDFKKGKFVRTTGQGMHAFCATQIPKNPAAAYREELGLPPNPEKK